MALPLCARGLNHIKSSAIRASRCFSSPIINFPEFINDPVLTFPPESEERNSVVRAIDQLKTSKYDIPCVIGGKEYRTAHKKEQLCPYNHGESVATFYYADKPLIEKAIDVALESRAAWESTPAEDRLAIFWKAADLFSGKYRSLLLASTMIGQGKTIHQAEIDATCELIDFYKYGVNSAMDLYSRQPKLHNPGVRNWLCYRGLEGFIATISPFNFTAIGGSTSGLPTAMGNVTVWKPADTAVLSNYIIYQILKESGLPDGVLNFVPADGPTFGDIVTSSPHLAGINFTGSAKTFKQLWRQVGANVDAYRTYPRLVGECGGKNYHYVHPDVSDITTVVNSTVRSAFEYQGQKCSACSRMYIPDSLWPQIQEGLVNTVNQIKMGSPEDFTSFMTAVIDSKSCARISDYLKYAESSPDVSVITGGKVNDSVGYYVEPTILKTTDPKNKLMQEEIFGPVLTIYVYPSEQWEKTLHLIDETSPYGLTGAIFAKDRQIISKLQHILRQTAGNFYINCQSTGSVVGQQPFGGSRASGTNDKAATAAYLQRWVSTQSIKEQTVPLTDWSYPSVDVQWN